ncbi:MAG: stage 0 sporulation protein [Clostridia bacterium]|nr:stage 0 sporulation protein [Clostridia bacterium]
MDNNQEKDVFEEYEEDEQREEGTAIPTDGAPTPAEQAAELCEVLIVGVRFSSGAKTYYFDPNGFTLEQKDSVVVETARGLEFGTVTVANRVISAALAVLPLKKVVRIATKEDIKRNEDNRAAAQRAKKICIEKIAKHKLDMKLVDAEYSFDNSKLLFYFTADGRVDFRELVKDLASAFRTRIELRQIGIRDEARAMGGIGICGRPFCCSSFLPDFVQVSIKMAKEQNFSLNSVKISGSCGRLMCCLRYEHEVYEEALKTTPAVNSSVMTENGPGRVVEARPLAQTVKVRLDEGNEPPKLYPCDKVTVLSHGNGKRPKPVQQPQEDKKEARAAEAERPKAKNEAEAPKATDATAKPEKTDKKQGEENRKKRNRGRHDHRRGRHHGGGQGGGQGEKKPEGGN